MRKNLSEIIEEISEEWLSRNADYITNRISGIVKQSIKNNDMYVSKDISELIGYASAAATVTSVELSTSILIKTLAELGFIEHDGHPNLHIVDNGK